MAKLELLNVQAHGGLRLGRPAVGSRHFVQIVAGEFAAAAAHCPVIFAKSPENGRFYAGAVFGFRPGENLLSSKESGECGFCPMDVAREGFFISGEDIAIDAEHPRFTAGEPLFDEDGGPSERLRQIQNLLGRFKQGIEETDRFINALLAHKVIEPIDISLRFDDGETIALEGVYTASLDALNDLDDATVLTLFRSGYLQLAYTMIASLKRIPVLATMRNRRLSEPAGS